MTYIYIPCHDWWYAVTNIDRFSRYPLALDRTPSHSVAEVSKTVDMARVEAERIIS